MSKKKKKNQNNKIKNKNSNQKQETKKVDVKEVVAQTKGKKKNVADVDNGQTKVVKVPKNKEKKPKKEKKHKKLKLVLKILAILIVLGILAVGGVVVGLFYGLFGEEFNISKDDLVIGASNSTVLDKDGNLIATLSGDERREIVTLADMPKYLPEAFIAIEDERFREHHGIDIQRTGYAIVNYVLKGGSSSFGGSTITQQLVKNITKEKDNEGIEGILRKVKEWVKAYQIEDIVSKDQILEMYLNILSMGGGGKNIHGVQLGAKFYFNKNVGDLSIEEAAFLAGINHAPNKYNPFKEEGHDEIMARIVKRTKTVLGKMQELGKISQEEYDTAMGKVDEGLKFEEGTVVEKVYSYHTDAAISEVVEDLAEANGWDTNFAQMKLESSGYTIYTTQDTNIQKRMEEEFLKEKYIYKSKQNEGEHTQAGMAIIDNSTGYVVGTVGGLGEKSARGFNYATQSQKQTGSAMKPLSVVAPALEEGIITAGSVYDDIPTNFKGQKPGWPKNYDQTYKGLSTVRYTIEISHNIAPVAILAELGSNKAVKFLKEMGFESIDAEADQNLALALGGLTNGSNPLEMAAGYEMIANDGMYKEPTFYTKVVDSNGNIILESYQETKRMMSVENAYILKNILTQPVVGASGTARYCAIKGMDVCAKTGTTNGDYDRWLCGFTPYYSAATWYGYKENETVKYKGSPSNPAGGIWDAIMADVHKDLEKKKFDVPSSIKRVSICKDSGMLAGEHCAHDQRGSRVYTEVFVNGTQPKSKCTVHVKTKVCESAGTTKLANEYCTDAVEKVFITREDSDKNDSWKKAADAGYMLPVEKCTTHKKIEVPVKNEITNSIKNTISNTIKNVISNTVKNTVNNTVTKPTNTVNNNSKNEVQNTVTPETNVNKVVKNVVNSVNSGTANKVD